MVGSTGSLMSMRLVRSKLRKREETASASPANIEAQTTNFGPHNRSHSSPDSRCSSGSSQPQQPRQHQNQSPVSTERATESLVASNNAANLAHNNNTNTTSNHQEVSFIRTGGGNNGGVVTNGWVFPPKAPTPNIYNCSNNLDALIAANEKNGFKGFRKQFSGRFKRLVAKKPQEPVPAIPPELKPQLKTIYVY